MNPIQAAARAGLRPKDQRPPWQWIEEHVGIRNSPLGNKPNFGLTPWLMEPSEVFADNRRHQMTLQCCVQGAKTFFMITHAAWALSEAPGPLGYYVQTNEHVKKVAQGRWLPVIENTPPLKALLRPGDRHAKGIHEIYFRHTFAYILAANESNAQSISLRYVFNDECAIWTPGILWETHKRATQWWNRRILNASTAADADTDFDKCFRAGDMRERRMCCPQCRHLQIPDFSKHIKWPTDESTKPDGRWNFDQVKLQTRFVCEKCGAALPHTEEISRFMNRHGDYLVTNPNAPYDQVSFRWPAMVLSPSVLSWGDLAVEFIQAAQMWKAGHHQPMRDFVRKREARTYDPRSVNPFENLPVIDITSPLPEKKFWALQDYIFMGVDVQIDHFWVLVQAWSKAGDECALLARKVYGWDDIELIQIEYNILHEDVGVDWSHRPQEVIRECARRGRWHTDAATGKQYWMCWRAYRGSIDYQFIYTNANKSKTPLPYKWPPAYGNPSVGLRTDNPMVKEFRGKRVPIITWSNPSIKDIVLARRDGRVDVKVETLRGDWNKEYFRQCHSQRKIQVQPKYGPSKWTYQGVTDDHLLDCRCQCTVRAIQRGAIEIGNVEAEPAPEPGLPAAYEAIVRAGA